jgi:hypothetical protein
MGKTEGLKIIPFFPMISFNLLFHSNTHLVISKMKNGIRGSNHDKHGVRISNVRGMITMNNFNMKRIASHALMNRTQTENGIQILKWNLSFKKGGHCHAKQETFWIRNPQFIQQSAAQTFLVHIQPTNPNAFGEKLQAKERGKWLRHKQTNH